MSRGATRAPRPRLPGMRPNLMLREIVVSALTQRVPTIMVSLLAAAMCLTTLLTVGRSAAAETQVQERLEAAGSRQLVVRDRNDEGFLTDDVVDLAASYSTVERAVGLGVATDMSNGALGFGATRVPTWPVLGEIRSVAELTAGRWPDEGEAIASAAALGALGLDYPVGFIVDRHGATFPVVGQFVPRDPFEHVSEGILVVAPRTSSVRALHVVVDTAEAVGPTQEAVLRTLARQDPQDLLIESPAGLAQLQQEVMGDLGNYGRGLMVLVLAGGAGLTAVVVMSDVLLRRVDLGRRRALGAPRSVIVALVVGRAVMAGLIGAAVGTAAAYAVLWDQPPVPEFAAGTAILAVLVAAVAAVPPAIAASRQDPVKVLRTP